MIYPFFCGWPLELGLCCAWSGNFILQFRATSCSRPHWKRVAHRYECSGFLGLQTAADSFLLSRAAPGAAFHENLEFLPFPVPAYTPNLFLLVAGALLVLVFMICFAYSVSRLVTLVVQERELKLREAMHIMGLRHDT